MHSVHYKHTCWHAYNKKKTDEVRQLCFTVFFPFDEGKVKIEEVVYLFHSVLKNIQAKHKQKTDLEPTFVEWFISTD